MLSKQNVVNAYKTCVKSSQKSSHQIDLVTGDNSKTTKQNREQKRNFSDVLNSKMRNQDNH